MLKFYHNAGSFSEFCCIFRRQILGQQIHHRNISPRVSSIRLFLPRTFNRMKKKNDARCQGLRILNAVLWNSML